AAADRRTLRVLRRPPRSSVGVVQLSLLGVGEHRVRLVYLLEAVFGAGVSWVSVGMMFGGQLTVRAADVLLRGVLADAKYLVVVLELRHRYAPFTRGPRRSARFSCPFPTWRLPPWPDGSADRPARSPARRPARCSLR